MIRYVFCVWLGWVASSPLPAVHPHDEAGPAEPHAHTLSARHTSQHLAWAQKRAHPVTPASPPLTGFETDDFLQHIGTMIVSRPSSFGDTMISKNADFSLSVQQGGQKVSVSHTSQNITWEKDFQGEPYTLEREGFFYAGDPPVIDNFLSFTMDAAFEKLDGYLPSDENTHPKHYILHLSLPGGRHIVPPLTSKKLTHLVLDSAFYARGHLERLQVPNLKAIDYKNEGYTLFPEINPRWRNVYVHAHHGFAFLPSLHRQPVSGEGNPWLPEDNQHLNQQYIGLYQDKELKDPPYVFVNDNEALAFDYAGASCGCTDFRQDIPSRRIGFFTTSAPNPWDVNTRPFTFRFIQGATTPLCPFRKGVRPIGSIEVASPSRAHSELLPQPPDVFKDISPDVWRALTSHKSLEAGETPPSITDHLMKEVALTAPGEKRAQEAEKTNVPEDAIINRLPDEIHVEIASYLSAQDLVNLYATCHYYRKLCQDYPLFSYRLLVWDTFGQNLPKAFNLGAMKLLGLPYIAPLPFAFESNAYELVLPDHRGTPLLTVSVTATHEVSPCQDTVENQAKKEVDKVCTRLKYMDGSTQVLEVDPFYITKDTPLDQYHTPIMFAISDRVTQWWCKCLEAIKLKRILSHASAGNIPPPKLPWKKKAMKEPLSPDLATTSPGISPCDTSHVATSPPPDAAGLSEEEEIKALAQSFSEE